MKKFFSTLIREISECGNDFHEMQVKTVKENPEICLASVFSTII